METYPSASRRISCIVGAILIPMLFPLLATLFVACGPSSAATSGASATTTTTTATAATTPTAGQTNDLCASLSATQLQQVTGVTFSPPIAHPITGIPNVTQAATCAAMAAPTTGNNTNGAVVFSPQIFTTPALASAFYLQQRTTEMQAGITITDLHGIGDQAFIFTNTQARETVLVAVKGAAYLMLSLDLAPPLAGAQMDAERLATLILAHL